MDEAEFEGPVGEGPHQPSESPETSAPSGEWGSLAGSTPGAAEDPVHAEGTPEPSWQSPLVASLSSLADGPATLPSQTTGARSRRGLLVVSVAVVVVAVAVITGVTASPNGPSLPGAGTAPADFVVSSTQATMGQHTAAVTIAGSVSVDGHTVPLQGTGSADFDTHAFSADVSFTGPSGSFVEDELVVDQHFYFGITADGSNLSTITGGPEWIDVPLPDQGSSSLGAGNIDPLDQMKLLEQKGATVVPLGGSTVNGTTVSGYKVTISRAEELQNLQEEIQSGALPQADQQQALKAVQLLGTPTLLVYFDGSGLLRRETVSLGSGAVGGAGAVTGSVQMDFSGFGSATDIVPPANSDIVSFAQFQQEARSYQASHQG